MIPSSTYGKARLARMRARKLSRVAVQPRHWSTVRAGVMPSVEHSAVPFIPDIATVVDVGGSRGQFATFALQRFPGARLICFEPLPGPRSQLIEVTKGRADVRALAVGAVRGRATLNVSNQDDSSSLLPIGRRQIKEFPGTEQAGTLDVDVTTIADEGLADTPSPRLLKIDVQGAELDVLRGAGDALDLFDDVFVECSFTELYDGQPLADEVIAYMLGRRLRLRGVFGIAYAADGTALQADLLFSRR